MRKTNTKKSLYVVTILCAAIFVFGCQATVFAAVDLVGRGTAATTTASATKEETQQTGASAASTSGQTANAPSQTGNTQSQAAVVTNNATVSKVGNAKVQTGVMEKIYPFLLGIGAAFLSLWVFIHLQMNQIRYGKSEKYYKELLDFICACKP